MAALPGAAPPPRRDGGEPALTEDVARMPDGVPHRVVGLTALFAVAVAVLIGFMFLIGNTATKVAAVVLAVIVVPIVIGLLRGSSERGRDHVHPSR